MTPPPAQPPLASSTEPETVPPRRGRGRPYRWAWGLGGLLVPVLLWELYKLLGPENGVRVGPVPVLPRTTDLAMPHVWEMVIRLLEPTTGASNAAPLWQDVASAVVFSLGIVAVGWLVGVLLGLALALLMQRFRPAKSAVLPWVVLSQTVPLIAIAPLVRRWGAQVHLGPLEWQNWMSVALIAAYLAFFPVAVGALRGLESPDAHHLDLMRTLGLGWWRILLHLRLPASVPYLIPSLRLAASSAVVGTVVAEVSIGLRGGVGRMIVEFAASTGGDPAKPWAPILGAVLLGLIAVGAVGLIGHLLRRYRREEISS